MGAMCFNTFSQFIIRFLFYLLAKISLRKAYFFIEAHGLKAASLYTSLFALVAKNLIFYSSYRIC